MDSRKNNRMSFKAAWSPQLPVAIWTDHDTDVIRMAVLTIPPPPKQSVWARGVMQVNVARRDKGLSLLSTHPISNLVEWSSFSAWNHMPLLSLKQNLEFTDQAPVPTSV